MSEAWSREWLVTNGLGGYASGSVAGVAARRYHGLLVAALPPPLGRLMMLNQLGEALELADGTSLPLAHDALVDFALDSGLPVWRWRVRNLEIERRVWMAYRANTTYVRYRLVGGDARVRLALVPAVHFRNHDAPVSEPLVEPYTFTRVGERFELRAPDPALPPLDLRVDGRGCVLTLETRPLTQHLYRTEESRGYPADGKLVSPGVLRVELARDADATLIATTEAATTIAPPAEALAAELARRRRLLDVARVAPDVARAATPAVAPAVADDPFAAELTLAADQFLIAPPGRGADARTVIAGYHWFTDWGRDTMISLEGLTLCTGRAQEARAILRMFARYVRDGLIPNFFPDGQNEGVYHTADATLWFFHAVDRYVAATGDRETLALLLPTMRSIIEHHVAGTRFGIGVDPADGLLRQGAEGYQLTWMDAKVDGWVVTPRRGKAVEINALWYNALRNCERWLRDAGDDDAAAAIAGHAERARASFDARFFCAARGWLYDVVDGEHGDDEACRPNQIFAVALPHAILAPEKWRTIVDVVRDKLLTPVGLRSLSPEHPDYKARYFGDLRTRDAAYHQGTVWSWLIGPFVDAWLRVHPDDRAGARALLRGFAETRYQACAGSVAEIYDGDAPFTPRGCIAQAWGVGEVLRAWRKTAT